MIISYTLLSINKNTSVKNFKNLFGSNRLSEEAARHLKGVPCIPELMYGYRKVHNKCADSCSYLWPTCSAWHTFLEQLITNKKAIKDSFNFATEIIDHNFNNPMGSLDIDALFTHITLEAAIRI